MTVEILRELADLAEGDMVPDDRLADLLAGRIAAADLLDQIAGVIYDSDDLGPGELASLARLEQIAQRARGVGVRGV